MEHVLDNPAWNALISGNKHLANGTDDIKYFDKDVSPFAAFRERSPDKLELLRQMIPDGEYRLLINLAEIEIPAGWKVLRVMQGFQMVCDTAIEHHPEPEGLVDLTEEHAPQMLALAKLTNPGPFEERTIAFGHYKGIFDGDKLVAMAGQRLHVFDFAEVSAVCTHPDYTGKGYARALLISQINRLRAASKTPFLHVRNDNDRAIKVYQSLGFVTRREVYFYAIKKVAQE